MTKEDAILAIRCNYPPENYTQLREALDLCIKELTPPTQEEVCEALEKFIPRLGKVRYNKETKCFEDDFYDDILNDVLLFKTYLEKLPPHLITLIGRFYEGVKK